MYDIINFTLQTEAKPVIIGDNTDMIKILFVCNGS